jgi:predicted GNAT family acetyltransferase
LKIKTKTVLEMLNLQQSPFFFIFLKSFIPEYKQNIMLIASNLTDNSFLRQYELKMGNQMATIEYSQQERKIFLTKLNIPTNLEIDDFSEKFIKLVLEDISEKNISVVPTSPPIAKFIKRNRRYKKMLPVGIRI